MKNIQIIDGADNCTFSIFQATDEEFSLIFPEPLQDIAAPPPSPSLPEQTLPPQAPVSAPRSRTGTASAR